MKTICLTAFFVFVALTAVMLVGRAIDQVQANVACMNTSAPCQTP